MKKTILLIASAVALISCGTTAQYTRGEQYPLMYEEKPVVLLVMPPINNTTNVEAKDLLYTSISTPLLEAGYYVISPLLAMDILKAESAYDAELFVDRPLEIFGKYFGADAVIFSEINSWAKTGSGIKTDLHYFIRSTRTNEILFDRTCNLYLDLSVDSGQSGLAAALVEAVASAINTAATKHIVAARRANNYIFSDIPRGKYSPAYMNDQQAAASLKDISVTVR